MILNNSLDETIKIVNLLKFLSLGIHIFSIVCEKMINKCKEILSNTEIWGLPLVKHLCDFLWGFLCMERHFYLEKWLTDKQVQPGLFDSFWN